jgi:hypothetical protein
MKKTIYFVIGCAIGLACTPTEKKSDELPVAFADTASFALSLDSVNHYRQHYDSVARKKLGQDAPVRAFTVRAVDLLEAIGLPKNSDPKYKFVRVYLGLDYKGHFRVFLTPVEGADISKGIAGKDITLTGPHSHGFAGPNISAHDGAYMLDFSSPCPNTCPK